jgi:hypothetical protein
VTSGFSPTPQLLAGFRLLADGGIDRVTVDRSTGTLANQGPRLVFSELHA